MDIESPTINTFLGVCKVAAMHVNKTITDAKPIYFLISLFMLLFLNL